ncbi:MAG: CinA family nicotinamide mononucleotide deamidase-related protein [Dysgonamonadaceae bacterium]|jgi:nicotinamide-nucleotide amidase|nr:CinA family nicotinamide mononucleotide deamidase-related protein [Dysgonamonadaceae bacterium]
MKIEIITIGDEILIGQIVDTNSAWLASELTKSGFEIAGIATVGDSAGAITDAITLSFSRADVLLLTGGIGPTNDDITKNTLCRYFDTPLVFSHEVLKNIRSIFARRKVQLNELTRNQAFVPENATVIQNKVGTAPVLWFEREGKVLVSMPGVPFEMKTAMNDYIIPRLKKQFGTGHYLKQSYLVSGITESALAILLTGFEKELPRGLSFAYLPSFGLIRLRLSAHGGEHLQTFRAQAEKLKKTLGDFLIADNEKSLEELLGEKLKFSGLTISTAESCTGGLIAHKITSVAGASDYYQGSIVSYANSVKEKVLHVDAKTIESVGVVSQSVVEQMAENCAKLLETDCAIAVSGIAGPSGGSAEKTVGTVWVCTYCRGKSVAKKYNTGNSRDENIARAANMAMLQMSNMLGGID